MSDTMLHGVLQMPPELWTNDAIDTAQRHGRYLEASKRIIELERQLDWALKSREAVWNSWNKALEERDEARRELAEARNIAKMAYTRSIGLGVSSHTQIQFMRDAINKWDKEQKDEAK